jgi:hypothetical protein
MRAAVLHGLRDIRLEDVPCRIHGRTRLWCVFSSMGCAARTFIFLRGAGWVPSSWTGLTFPVMKPAALSSGRPQMARPARRHARHHRAGHPLSALRGMQVGTPQPLSGCRVHVSASREWHIYGTGCRRDRFRSSATGRNG